MIISADMEWCSTGIDVLGLAWNEGRYATATGRTDVTMRQFINTLNRADIVVMQNGIDADLVQLRREGLDVSGFDHKMFDTRLAAHAVAGHLAGTGSYDLRSLVLLFGARQGQRFSLDWKEYASALHRTCAFDAAATGWVYPTLDRLITSRHLEGIVKTAHAVQPIFTRMREQGVRLDTAVLNRIYAERKLRLERNIEEYGLWEERGVKKIRRVPIWRSPKVLDKFEQQFGIRPANLQRSTWIKLAANTNGPPGASAFASVIVELGRGANDAHWLGKPTETEDHVDFSKVSADGFIYPRYDICGSPDRAIASNPNIQNFPRPADDPRPVPLRQAVIPLRDDHSILGVDFSSIETITNAYESGDMDRVMATLRKEVTHEGTAALINDAFKLSLTRQQGKAVNHGVDKGESPWNLARLLFNTERPSRQQVIQCQQICEKMLSQFPKTSEFRDTLWERSVENPLLVTNSFGRQLQCFSRSKYGDASERYAKHSPEKKYWCSCSACAPRRDRWKYAIAFLGRSCAFDALLQKMSNLWYTRRLDDYSLPYLEVHDELDFSVPTADIEKYARLAKECFEEPVAELGGLCLPADVKWGSNWAAAH